MVYFAFYKVSTTALQKKYNCFVNANCQSIPITTQQYKPFYGKCMVSEFFLND